MLKRHEVQVLRRAGHTLEVSASVGVAAYPESAMTAETLLHAADTAMYAAKKAGAGRFAVAPPAPSGIAAQGG